MKTPFERCLDVLALLCESPEPLSAHDLSVQLGTPKSSVHRFLLTLNAAGWIEQDQSTGLYKPSLKMMVMGQRLLLQTRIPEICQPFLDRLAEATRLLVRMTIVSANALTWIGQSQGACDGLIYQPKPTAKVSLHTTASGKAWLATLDREAALRLALESGLGKPDIGGPNAIRTVAEFSAELDRTAQRGWAGANEETEADIGAIACAIRRVNETVGTVSVDGPVRRFAKTQEIAALVTRTATDLSSLWPYYHAENSADALKVAHQK